MQFNSLEYFLFLSIVFLLYWLIRGNYKLQNLFLLLVSYFFYACWDYRFLALIIASSFTDYVIGLMIYNSSNESHRKYYLWGSLLINLGILFTFKYFNFFYDSFKVLVDQIGFQVNPLTLELLLPVGISFYTFQTLSYTIDIYRHQLVPNRSVISFFAFVAFFPQLIAGPIERASNLLPQFNQERIFSFEKGRDGCRQILWGLFKKVVIADNCANIVNYVMNVSDYGVFSAYYLWIGAMLFSIQIYCDFSGYSDIAIGTARLFGFDLKQNFSMPYFSRNLPEFWRRWHISLSTWFKDYLYIPLGGNRVNKVKQLRNIFLVFVISGLWHGANWNFLFWGFFHAIIYSYSVFLNTPSARVAVVSHNYWITYVKPFFNMFSTFLIVTIAWVFFRIENIFLGFNYIKGMFTFSTVKIQGIDDDIQDVFEEFDTLLFFILIMLIVEWVNRAKEHGLKRMFNNVILRYLFYMVLIFSVLEYFSKDQPFIYFQF